MALLSHPLIETYMARQHYDLSAYAPDFSLPRRAVLVETRALPQLDWTLRNIAFHTGWPILVYCSRDNEHVIDKLGFAVEKRLIDPIRLPDYTYALVSAAFWRSMPETVLLFQTDAFMLRSGIEDYLQYDYAGAPWKWARDDERKALFRIGGNGGFSLRRTAKMLEIIDALPFSRVYADPVFGLPEGVAPPEDMYFAYGLASLGGRVPNPEAQARFCVETVFHPAPLAVHGIDRQLDSRRISALLFPDGDAPGSDPP